MDLYIHIGMGKTGSSAIQSFLNKNRHELLKDFSCLYPVLSPQNDAGFFSGYCLCHGDFFGSKKFDFIDSQIRNMIKKAENKKIQKIILSSEALSVWPKMADFLCGILSDYPEIRVFIIVYIRRQDNWLESAWKQWGVKDKQFKHVDDFLEKYNQVSPYNYNPLEIVELWGKKFGHKNILVQPYEKEQLPDGIIIDFLNKVGVDYTKIQGYDPKKDKYHINIGFNRDIIEIFNLNKDFYKNIHDNRLIVLFTKYLPDTYKKVPFDEHSFFSPQQRLKVIGEYQPYYESIAKKYLSREDGRLFYEQSPELNDPWEQYEGLTVEKIVPIFTQMLYNMDKKNSMQLKNIYKKKQVSPENSYFRKIKVKILSLLR